MNEVGITDTASASNGRKASVVDEYNPHGATKNSSFKRSIRGPPSVNDKNKKCRIEVSHAIL